MSSCKTLHESNSDQHNQIETRILDKRSLPPDLADWLAAKQALIASLTETAERVDARHARSCACRIVGNTISSLGGGLFVAGVTLAPLSSGLTLPALATGGCVLATVGNLASVSSVVYTECRSRRDLAKAQRLLGQFTYSTHALLSRRASIYWQVLFLRTYIFCVVHCIKNF